MNPPTLVGYLTLVTFPCTLTPQATLLGNDYFNLYLVRGETSALVEGAVSAVAYPLLKQLEELRVRPESISHLVILHSHFDHLMVFPFLKARYPWLKIVSSEKNETLLSNPKVLSRISESDRRITEAMIRRGMISEAPDLPSPPSFPLDVTVREGSCLDLGHGVRIRFLEAPGHSPDGLCAHMEDHDVLFCSDAAGFYAPPEFYRPNYWFSLGEAVRSIEKMKSLHPEILCSGHYGAVVGREKARRHLDRARQSIDDFSNAVAEETRRGKSIDEIAQEVTERFSRGFLELFPLQDNFLLWRLLVRRTLEHLETRTKANP